MIAFARGSRLLESLHQLIQACPELGGSFLLNHSNFILPSPLISPTSMPSCLSRLFLFILSFFVPAPHQSILLIHTRLYGSRHSILLGLLYIWPPLPSIQSSLVSQLLYVVRFLPQTWFSTSSIFCVSESRNRAELPQTLQHFLGSGILWAVAIVIIEEVTIPQLGSYPSISS